jgi:hypothetical protein
MSMPARLVPAKAGIEAQLQAEVAELMAKAEAADQADVPDGLSIPDEFARREERLQQIAAARAKIEARAKERFEREQAEHRAKLAAREAREKATGKKSGGKPPEPPVEGPQPTDQINLTDEASRIMPVSGGGFEQCYNAQAVVAEGSLLVLATNVVQAPNDKQQLEPMLAKINALPSDLGKADVMLGDNGYFSAANVTACLASEIEPLLAMGRDAHHQPLSERFADAPPAPENPTPVEAMAYRLRTPEGKKLYALRKHTPEPVFGIVKLVPAKAGIGARIPSVPAARARQSQWRVDARHHGLERETHVCTQGRLRLSAIAVEPTQ